MSDDKRHTKRSDEISPLGTFVAERHYQLATPEGTYDIIVRIGAPVRNASGRYDCLAQIEEPSGTITRPMNGADGVEALQLALIQLGVDLQLMAESPGAAISWLGQSRHGIGLPVQPAFSLLYVLETPS